MAEVNPAAFLHNAGSTHTGVITRAVTNVLTAGRSAAMVARGGVNWALANKFTVTQTGSPSMAVLVNPGEAVIPGTENTTLQGSYAVLLDAQLTKSIAAAHATLNRIDIVVLRVRDAFYSGSDNDWLVEVVTGTPASSPAAPSAPANSIVIAEVTVGAAVTSIVNANITDKRPFLAALGGLIPCTSVNRPSNSEEGQAIYETDTEMLRIFDGTNWLCPTDVQLGKTWKMKTADETVNNSASLQDDDHLTMTLEASSVYFVEFFGVFSSGTTPDFKYTFAVPSGATGSNLGYSGWSFPPFNGISWTATGILTGTGANEYFNVTGRLATTNGGVFKLQWAQNTANASNTTLRLATMLRATKTG